MNKNIKLKKEIEKRVAKGLIRKQVDGDELTIYNYTEECQFNKAWDKYSLMARGLILNKEGKIVARPFDKFFNLNEGTRPEEIPLTLEETYNKYGKPIIEEKMDGSLGILYWYYDKWNFATRGSFASDQSIHASKKMFTGVKNLFMLDTLDKGATHMFEIIYPENRIVVDYKGEDTLYYLWSRTNKEGTYYKEGIIQHFFPTTKSFNDLSVRENAEGYILFFPEHDYRIKIKFDEYVRLHRIISSLTPKNIWEAMKSGVKIDLKGVPEEYSDSVGKFINETQKKYDDYVEVVEKTFKSTNPNLSRKEKALIWKTTPNLTPMLFARLDGRDYSKLIWDKIKPKETNL